MSNFFSKPEIRKLNRMSYTMTWFCSDLNYMPSIFPSYPGGFIRFLAHVEQVSDLQEEWPLLFHLHTWWLPSLSISPPSRSIPLSSPLGEVCISVFISCLAAPGDHTRLPPLPHHLIIIIHLGGRISTAWDIRPITKPQPTSSPLAFTVRVTGRNSVLTTSCWTLSLHPSHSTKLSWKHHQADMFFSKPRLLWYSSCRVYVKC